MLQNPHVLFTFDKIDNPLHLPRGTTSEPPKVARTCGVLSIFASNCASNNGVRFFDISTSKSGPVLRCFIHVDFEMCFAPQRRALFRHRNFQKWSDTEVLYILTSKCASRHNGMRFFDIATSKSGPILRCFTFWLRNVLRATTACAFSTSQLPKVVRGWGVLYILPSKCASRHNGVHFFMSHVASWLRTRRFSEPTFRPSGATNHWKTQCFATVLPFRASASSFFWLFLFSDLLSSTLLFSLPLPYSAFHLSILSEVWLLNFLRQVFDKTRLHLNIHNQMKRCLNE